MQQIEYSGSVILSGKTVQIAVPETLQVAQDQTVKTKLIVCRQHIHGINCNSMHACESCLHMLQHHGLPGALLTLTVPLAAQRSQPRQLCPR